jgi:phenylpropionate dioxygenase-like ring-hydroxylating dioxygenase large terminal subunit
MNAPSTTDARTSPVAVWRVLESLKGEALTAWRTADVGGRASVAERNLDLPYPFGWFVACYSDELAVGEVKPLRYFGRDLVLWRGEDGVTRMTDAYCRHLGAHMGYGGRVSGTLLECPFHGWKYDETGVVKEIPYAKRVPPQGRRPCDHRWPVVEKNRFVWFWYHPNGAEPAWEVRDFPEVGDPAWTAYDRYEWRVFGALQNMAENGVDAAHFQFIHGTADFPQYEIAFDGYERTARVEAKMATPKGVMDGAITYGTTGPGQSWTKFSGISETLLIAGATPVAKDEIHVRFAFTQPKAEVDAAPSLARALIRNICKQLDQDKVVWDRQRYQERPALCDGDGPIAAFRAYYGQFYAEWEDDPDRRKLTHLDMRRTNT